MSWNAATKSSTSVLEKLEHERGEKLWLSWRNVKFYVETAMPWQAGVACVDLDSVILYHDSEDSHLGRVLPLGRKLVNLLRKRWYVVVLTSRSRGHQKILTYLHKNNVWVDEVTNRKPYADVYMDDKAIRIPKNWK